jgi:hypothetical protein
VLTPIPARQFTPPYPKWYDINAYCEFHSGVQGHSTDNCYILRNKLYELMDRGVIKLTTVDPTPAATVNNTASTSTTEGGINEIDPGLFKN